MSLCCDENIIPAVLQYPKTQSKAASWILAFYISTLSELTSPLTNQLEEGDLVYNPN